MRRIYLDNQTTTRPSEASVKSMMPFLNQMWGVSSAPHQMGQEVLPAMEESFRSIYELLGAEDDDNFVFTSSGAEAVNHAIFSVYLDVTRQSGKNHYITSVVDEAPSIMAVGRLEQLGCVGTMVEVDKQGVVTPQIIKDAITPRTALVSLSWANAMTGTIHPVLEIAQVCRERGVLLHIDATHILGKLYFLLREIGADMISFNGDHFHAPKGTGGLYVRAGLKSSPLIVGGMDQGGQRAGNVNVPALVALGRASKEALEHRDFLCTEVARLRDRLELGIVNEIPDAIVFFRDSERLPGSAVVGFPGVSNDALLYVLNRKGVFASFGGGNFQQLGLLLEASGVDHKLAHCALSFGLSRYTTEEEIDLAVKIIAEGVRQLKNISKGVVGN